MINEFRKRNYFFDNGIRFSCQKCGKCCTGSSGTIYVSDSEIESIAEFLCCSIMEMKTKFLYPFKDSYSIHEKENGDCIFYDRKNGCKIQPVKPMQCSTFPFWVENMRSTYKWKLICQECIGIGVGKVYSKEEILSILENAPI